MQRTWFETIHLLGLDVEVAIALGLLALDQAKRLVARLVGVIGQHRAAVRSQTRATGEIGADPWSTQEWHPSH